MMATSFAPSLVFYLPNAMPAQRGGNAETMVSKHLLDIALNLPFLVSILVLGTSHWLTICLFLVAFSSNCLNQFNKLHEAYLDTLEQVRIESEVRARKAANDTIQDLLGELI